jgi:hypothetical protein
VEEKRVFIPKTPGLSNRSVGRELRIVGNCYIGDVLGSKASLLELLVVEALPDLAFLALFLPFLHSFLALFLPFLHSSLDLLLEILDRLVILRSLSVLLHLAKGLFHFLLVLLEGRAGSIRTSVMTVVMTVMTVMTVMAVMAVMTVMTVMAVMAVMVSMGVRRGREGSIGRRERTVGKHASGAECRASTVLVGCRRVLWFSICRRRVGIGVSRAEFTTKPTKGTEAATATVTSTPTTERTMESMRAKAMGTKAKGTKATTRTPETKGTTSSTPWAGTLHFYDKVRRGKWMWRRTGACKEKEKKRAWKEKKREKGEEKGRWEKKE